MTTKQQLKENGYAVIKGVFTKDEVAKIKTEAYGTNVQAIERLGYNHNALEKSGQRPALLFFPAIANHYLNSIRTDKRLVKIVKSILGNNVKQLNNQIYFREPGDDDQFNWHQDIIFRTPEEDFTDIEQGYLQTIIVVDQLTKENGAIEFCPGTHKLGKTDTATLENLREYTPCPFKNAEYVEAEPGDVLVWSVMVVHGSKPNKSQTQRMTYMNGFAKAECSKHFPLYLEDGEVVKTINARAIP